MINLGDTRYCSIREANAAELEALREVAKQAEKGVSGHTKWLFGKNCRCSLCKALAKLDKVRAKPINPPARS